MYKGLPKTNFFDFIRFDTVLTNVLNTILRPCGYVFRSSTHYMLEGRPQPPTRSPGVGPFARGADESLRPAEPRKVLATRLLRDEAGLKLSEGARVVLHSRGHYLRGYWSQRTYPLAAK